MHVQYIMIKLTDVSFKKGLYRRLVNFEALRVKTIGNITEAVFINHACCFYVERQPMGEIISSYAGKTCWSETAISTKQCYSFQAKGLLKECEKLLENWLNLTAFHGRLSCVLNHVIVFVRRIGGFTHINASMLN